MVGPFDLGTVVLRFGLNIDPYTAQVSVDPSASEPIPTIIDGIVTHVRDIRVYIDRPQLHAQPDQLQPDGDRQHADRTMKAPQRPSPRRSRPRTART